MGDLVDHIDNEGMNHRDASVWIVGSDHWKRGQLAQ